MSETKLDCAKTFFKEIKEQATRRLRAADDKHLLERDLEFIADMVDKAIVAIKNTEDNCGCECHPGNGNAAENWCSKHGADGCPDCIVEMKKLEDDLKKSKGVRNDLAEASIALSIATASICTDCQATGWAPHAQDETWPAHGGACRLNADQRRAMRALVLLNKK